MTTVVLAVVGLIVGALLGFLIVRIAMNGKLKSSTEQAARLVEDAQGKAESIKKDTLMEAKDEVYKMRQEAQAEAKERERDLKAMENRILQREESADRRVQSLDDREHKLSSMQGQIESRERHLTEREKEIDATLERVAGLTAEDAKQELLDTVRDEVTLEEANILRESEERVRAEADKKSREILSVAIQRVAADHTAETTVSTVHIPSDDIKGRIIGREGRNIRQFEQLTGINMIIDDTPETVVLSSFDPVRREIGRITLENLIADGRIHPARIEEMFHKAEKLVNERIQEAGEQAAFDVGIHDLHPELVKTLGRLRYRTSYGQNVLNHSVEVASLAGVMASELGLDPRQAKRAGLLHDIGKAIDHEVEGSHAVIGADLCRRYGESPAIVHAIEAHHADVEPTTVVAFLVQAADAVSASRPGARRESVEGYIKRLEKLESIANAHPGVVNTYAMQAGREVRVMVEPESVSDADAVVLAHDIAQEIEQGMEYPGQIKVLVIRESRAMDIAK
ncbi:MAG: ribonuclease Y [Coriobacteriales bacterium]|nr:ribonuclease Y [Coriobacteriales bacterium]